jgi:type IV pilus assembly protein PilB
MFLSKQFGVPFVKLGEFEVPTEVIRSVPMETAQRHLLVPIHRAGNTISVAMADPTNVAAIDDVKFMTGCNVEPVVASEVSIRAFIDRYYDSATTLSDMIGEIGEETMEVLDTEEVFDPKAAATEAEHAPVVKLVNVLLADAIKKGASDIHIEPYEKHLRVRLRIDGILYEIMRPPMRLRTALTSRVKIMSELDITERRLPQDGRMKVRMKNKEVDFRVSTLPTLFGEKVVLRLLDKSSLMLDMTKLGFDGGSLKVFQDAIESPYGMVLVTGPTGSGKTTTLYSALDRVNREGTNIMTAEDPVEFNLMGINQVQMRESIGLNFAAALRSFLRQDPDIVMVGEIRDFETAEIAIKAALTGHLVFSTLHTNDAPSSINRLLNMGIEPFLVSSSVIMIMAQRLARRICKDCKEQLEVPTEGLVSLGFSEEEARGITCYHGKGCSTCSDTGYKGRVALYEVMPVGEEIRELVLRGGTTSELKQQAVALGMDTLRQAGLKKVEEGITTIEEVLRCSFAD